MKQRLKVVTDENESPIEALSDDDMMRLIALNRRDAFEALVIRYQALVFGLATRFLGDRDKGRDVTQDVFLALWAERHRFRPKGMFRSYLMSVCINRCRVVTRGRRNTERKTARFSQEMSTSPFSDENDIPLEMLLKREQQRELQRYLTKLPEKCREVMIHRFTLDLQLNEVAELLGMPLGTVKSHVQRGLSSIRRMMKKGR